jgi:hypothetical protein
MGAEALVAAIARAEAAALTTHAIGACGESQWSCSHCEAATSVTGGGGRGEVRRIDGT